MASLHLFEQIKRNKRNSILLIVAICTLFVLLGVIFGFYIGDPLIGLVAAGIFALIYTLFTISTGDKLVLMSMRAKPIQKNDHPQLFNIVEEMSIASGLPMPKVYMIQSEASNAFATGRSPEKASIAVTSGLLQQVNREELQAIIGHEMGHIKNFDTRFAIMMAVMVGAIALLCDAFWRIAIRSRRSSSSNSSGGGQAQLVILVAAIVLAILAPIAAKLIQLAMSRRRELLADNTAAVLTRNPEALASALEKIAADPDELDIANRGTQHLFVVNPLRAAKDNKRRKQGKPIKEKAGWFDTHPPIATRVRILREMAHTAQFSEASA